MAFLDEFWVVVLLFSSFVPLGLSVHLPVSVSDMTAYLVVRFRGLVYVHRLHDLMLCALNIMYVAFEVSQRMTSTGSLCSTLLCIHVRDVCGISRIRMPPFSSAVTPWGGHGILREFRVSLISWNASFVEPGCR